MGRCVTHRERVEQPPRNLLQASESLPVKERVRSSPRQDHRAAWGPWDALPGAAPPPNFFFKVTGSPVPTQYTPSAQGWTWPCQHHQCPSDETKEEAFPSVFLLQEGHLDLRACGKPTSAASEQRGRQSLGQLGVGVDQVGADQGVDQVCRPEHTSLSTRARQTLLSRARVWEPLVWQPRGSWTHPTRSCRWKPPWTVSKTRRKLVFPIKLLVKIGGGTSLVVQWLRIPLPMQGT